jgi:hypothetical protein
MNFDFGSTLARAWKITWENKILWIFGILASLGGGTWGSGVNYNFGGGGGSGGGQPQLPPDVQRFLDRLGNDPVFIAIIIGVVCGLLLLGLVLFVLSIIGRGGLIGGAQLAEANGKVTFGEAWSAGTRHFLTLFLIGLATGLVVLALFVVTIVPGVLLTVATLGFGLLCLLPLICLLVIVAIILGIIAYFAQIAAVTENLGVGAAFGRAWAIIKANLGPIIILGVILAVIGGIIGFVTALPLIAIVFPPMIGLLLGDKNGLGTGIAIAIVCGVAYLPVLLFISGVLQTWITSTWVLAYKQFTGPAAAPASPYSVTPPM